LDVVNAKNVKSQLSGHLDTTLTGITTVQPPSNQVFQTVQQGHNQPENMVN